MVSSSNSSSSRSSSNGSSNNNLSSLLLAILATVRYNIINDVLDREVGLLLEVMI